MSIGYSIANILCLSWMDGAVDIHWIKIYLLKFLICNCNQNPNPNWKLCWHEAVIIGIMITYNIEYVKWLCLQYWNCSYWKLHHIKCAVRKINSKCPEYMEIEHIFVLQTFRAFCVSAQTICWPYQSALCLTIVNINRLLQYLLFVATYFSIRCWVGS